MSSDRPCDGRPLRVLVVSLHYAPELTGNAPYVTELAEELASRGHRVRVLTAHPHYPGSRIRPGYGQWRRLENESGVDLVRLLHFVPRRVTTWARLAAELSFGVRAVFERWDRPDVVVLVSPALFSSAVVSLRAALLHPRARRILWVQDLYSLGVAETGAAGSVVGGIVGAIEQAVLRAASAVAVIHPRFATHVDGALGRRRTRVRVVRNWSHVEPVSQDGRDAVRAGLGWGDEWVVLHAGNMGVKQGLENLVETARLIDQRGLPVRMVLLGDGNQRSLLAELGEGIRSLQFIDPITDEQDFFRALAAADVLAVNELPGVASMSVPSKITTYFATGRPVVAAAGVDGATADELQWSGGGLLVPPGDPAALLAAVEELRADPERAGRLGAAGADYRERTLGRDVTLRRFARLIERAARIRSR